MHKTNAGLFSTGIDRSLLKKENNMSADIIIKIIRELWETSLRALAIEAAKKSSTPIDDWAIKFFDLLITKP